MRSPDFFDVTTHSNIRFHTTTVQAVDGRSVQLAGDLTIRGITKPVVLDVEIVGEVHGAQKQGAGYGYTHTLGYHPILATRSDTGEVLHVRLRKGQANTQRGVLRFLEELVARVRRAGATGPILVRADSGFWNKKAIAYLRKQGALFSIGVPMHKSVAAQIALIADDAWQPVDDYPDSGVCELAETTLGDERLIVRRVHLHAQAHQTELFTYWRHFAFLTNRTETMLLVDTEHRQHAQVELVIRDLKDQSAHALPVRALQRQQRLDGDRLSGAQPRALDRHPRSQRPDAPDHTNAALPTVCCLGAADPQRPDVDAALARPLAMGTRISHCT